MTLGCGSWGGNVTSDNVSPLHLMDIKRVAFETRPVASKRPAVATQPSVMPAQPSAASRPAAGATQAGTTPKVSREEIAAIVDRFLANRQPESAPPSAAPQTDYSGGPSGNGVTAGPPASVAQGSTSAANGRKAAEFISEDDVKRAIQKGEKIYVGPRTIITPSARDIGDPAEVFAKA